jgi:hypothetical protein
MIFTFTENSLIILFYFLYEQKHRTGIILVNITQKFILSFKWWYDIEKILKKFFVKDEIL